LDNVEFGKIIADLRKQKRTENGKGWTRKMLGEYLHLTPHQVGRLERGERKYLDTETLHLLAKAFNLTALERKELFYAAVDATEGKITNSTHTESKATLYDLSETLSKMQAPAFVLDEYADIIAANLIILKLYRVSEKFIAQLGETPASYNLLKFIYSSDSGYRDIVGNAWEKLAKRNTHFFRRVSLRQRHTTYFKKILDELHREKEFDIHWHAMHIAPQQYDSIYDTLKWTDPLYGPIELILTESSIPTEQGNLYLFPYTPGDKNTASVFSRIAEEVDENAPMLAPWPDKPWS